MISLWWGLEGQEPGHLRVCYVSFLTWEQGYNINFKKGIKSNIEEVGQMEE